MHKITPTELQPILDDVAQSPERSTLFWWLREHHDVFLAAAAGRRIRWLPHIPRFLALDLRDGEGKPVTPRTASDTWAEVKRDIARVRASQAEQVRKLQPSRLPVTWRPQAATPPPSSRAVVQPHSGPAAATGTEDRTPEELVAGLRRVMKERSGQ